MTRDEVFDLLTRHGVHRVEVEFSGGGDEGYCEEARFFGTPDSSGKDTPIEPEWNAVPTDDYPDLQDVLEEPVYDEFGGFNGQGAHGTLTWDVPARKVWIEGSTEEWVPFERKEPGT